MNFNENVYLYTLSCKNFCKISGSEYVSTKKVKPLKTEIVTVGEILKRFPVYVPKLRKFG